MLRLKSLQKPMPNIGTKEPELKYVLSLISSGSISSKEVIEFAWLHTGLQPTIVKAALESCCQIVEHYVALGYRVNLGELGTFYPSIKSKAVESNTKAGMAQLEGIFVRFKPSSDVLEKVRKAEKELTGIFKLVDPEKGFYEEVGREELGDSDSNNDEGDDPSQDSGGGNTGDDGGFAG